LGVLKSLKILSPQDAALKRFPELMSKTTSSDECVNLRHIRCQLCAVTVKDEKNLQARVQNKFFHSYDKVADTVLTFWFFNCSKGTRQQGGFSWVFVEIGSA
jgi:hypothetical protein